MRSFIAGTMAVLGTVLILSGAAALWATTLTRPRGGNGGGIGAGGGATTAAPAIGARPIDQIVDRLGRIPGPDRMIGWGVVLLALSAIAAGAISFSATATAGTR